ncbi:hypothetical protein NMY22_g4413 [Coprinellus aureogranulatus]|nr:hypothetical protein NMY22_g4413 [Coprinellus aureogranulatus]
MPVTVTFVLKFSPVTVASFSLALSITFHAMTSAAYSIANVFRRLLQRSSMVPNLPNELIFEEILSYFHDDHPTSLEGLQATFACKEFYQRLQPVIARFYVERLVEAYGKGRIQSFYPAAPDEEVETMTVSQFTELVEAAFERSCIEAVVRSRVLTTFELSYTVQMGEFSDSRNAIWSLCSLLSRPYVAKHLRYFELSFLCDHPAGNDEGCSSTPDDEWKRAVTMLLEHVSSGPQGVELLLYTGSSLIGDNSHTSLGRQPNRPSPFSNSRVRDLCISGCILDLLWPSEINSLLRGSLGTLTHLTFCRCHSAIAKWKSTLVQCHLPVLQQFIVFDTNFPLDILSSFLLLNPSITSADIRMPSSHAFQAGTQLPICREDRLRFLPRICKLTGTTDFLLALLTPASGTDVDIPLFNLEELHIVMALPCDERIISAADYNSVTDVLSRIPSPYKTGKKALIALRSIALEISYSQPATELWFDSATTGTSTSGGGRSEGGVAIALIQAVTDFVLPPSPPFNLMNTLGSLGHITTLNLIVGEFAVSPRHALHPGTVVSFLSALPALEEVVLERVFGHPRDTVDDAEQFWGCLGGVWDACAKLETMEIQGIGGSETSAIWKRGEVEPQPGVATWAHAFAI